MLLSKLVYLSVKNVLYYSDSSFTYDAFLEGNFDSDPDYATNINNVFLPLNEALARLNDLNRIPYKIQEIEFDSDEEEYNVDLTTEILDDDENTVNVKEVVDVGVFVDGIALRIPFIPFGLNKIHIEASCTPIYVEYKEDIPMFSIDDLVERETDDDGNVVDDNIDLRVKYGITEAMSNYIIEYIQGKLLEPIAPELANMHLTRAETYFSNFPTVDATFRQKSVARKFKIGA